MSVTREDLMVLQNQMTSLSEKLARIPSAEELRSQERQMAALSENLSAVKMLVENAAEMCPYRETIARASNNVARMSDIEKLLPGFAKKDDLVEIKSNVTWLIRGSGALIALGGVAALIANIMGLW